MSSAAASGASFSSSSCSTRTGSAFGVSMVQPNVVLSNRPRVNWLASGMGVLLVRAAARTGARGVGQARPG